MSTLLRIEMVVLACIVMLVVFRSINKGKLMVRFSLLWIGIAIGMTLCAVFPGIVVWFCGVIGIETPSNLMYLLGILVLLVLVFKQSEILSQQTEQIKKLTQELSILKKQLPEQGESHATK